MNMSASAPIPSPLAHRKGNPMTFPVLTVEELRQMTLTDYRRLAEDAISCIRKVYEKIQRLGNESFSQKAEGIKAWRDSEVYQLYVAMGQESLLGGKPVAVVIATRQQAGKPVLTGQEFSFVADLNKKLRF
jgi:hypothetical protein